MAPAVVSTRRNAIASQDAQPPRDQKTAVLEALRAFKDTVLKNSEDVGAGFADEARRIHFGEAEERNIRGRSTPEEAQALFEDGVAFGILPPLPEDFN
jgi:hypothetical protein